MALLEIFEIVERILLFLPLKDMLIAKRISPFFATVVCESHSIQQALFFKRVTAGAGSQHRLLAAHGDVKSPAFTKTAEPWLSMGMPKKILANPLLSNHVQYVRTRIPKAAFTLDKRVLCDSTDGASWRQMLVMQPHAALLTLVEYSEDNLTMVTVGELEAGQTIDVSQGLRMEEVIDRNKSTRPISSCRYELRWVEWDLSLCMGTACCAWEVLYKMRAIVNDEE